MKTRKRCACKGTGFFLYETGRGWGAVVMGDAGVLEVYLPFEVEGREELVARVRDDYPEVTEGAADSVAARAARKLVSFFAGEAVSFADIPVDMSCFSPFQREVYGLVSSIPAGTVLTYGAVAAALGKPQAARGIGSAMGRNPVPVIIPCHRVVGSAGTMTGYTAPGGVESKQWLLRLEGVELTERGRVVR